MGDNPERRNIVRRQEDHVSHAKLTATVGRIIDVLDGPVIEHLDGTTERVTDQGMVARQERIEENQLRDGARLDGIEKTLSNGIKVRQSISWRDKAQIIAAFIAAVGAIIVAGIS